MGDHARDRRLIAGGLHGVHVLGRGSQRLLEVHVGSGICGGDDQIAVIAHFPGGHHGDVGLLNVQHLAVVRVGGAGAGFLGRLGPAVVVRVGQGHDFRTLDADESHVEIVAVIASPGMPDDSDFEAHTCVLPRVRR